MKKFWLKICALAIACATVLGSALALAGCGGDAKYKIGVLLDNFTDIQGQQIQSYADDLESGFDVEFVYVSVGQDDDSHIQGVESCINQGCNAIFSGYNTAIDMCIDMCESAGVYYGLLKHGDPVGVYCDVVDLIFLPARYINLDGKVLVLCASGKRCQRDDCGE